MFNEFKKMVNACGDDITLSRRANGTYRLTLEDFEGFDEHWHEVEREYDNEEAVNALIDWLETIAQNIMKTFIHIILFLTFR